MSKDTAVKTTGCDRTQRPEGITDEHLEYLDELRESGVTNMFGAGPYLDRRFPDLRNERASFHSSPQARDILAYWMESFGNENR